MRIHNNKPPKKSTVIRSEKYGLTLEMYPFRHVCSECGHSETISYDGKFFMKTFPMGMTKKALGDGSKKSRAAAAPVDLDEEESY